MPICAACLAVSWACECGSIEALLPDFKRFLDTWASHCGAPRSVFVGQLVTMMADVIKQAKGMKSDGETPLTPLMLLLALCPNIEEDVLLALRFLYYVKAKPVVPDARYDEAERAFLARPEVEDSALMNPGSDSGADYPDHVKALAFYLSIMGWEAGQRAGQEAAANTVKADNQPPSRKPKKPGKVVAEYVAPDLFD